MKNKNTIFNLGHPDDDAEATFLKTLFWGVLISVGLIGFGEFVFLILLILKII